MSRAGQAVLVSPWRTVPTPRRVTSPWLALLLVGTAGCAAAVGAAATIQPMLALAGVLVIAVSIAVCLRPEAAAYIAIGATPLVVGIDRDRLVPMLRPNEALLGLLIAVLVARAVMTMQPGARPRLHLGPIAIAILLFAVTSSILPLFFMALRGRTIEMDDITYAAVLWKHLALYTLIRYTIKTEKQIRICLWVSMVAAAIVGLIAILQSLDMLGVRQLLIPWYAPFGYTEGFEDPRAGSTIGLPVATADLMIFNLAVAVGCAWRDKRTALYFLAPMCLIYVMATFSAAEFSSILGMVLAIILVAARLRRLDLLRYGVAALPVGAVLLWPTLEHRLVEFQSLHGVPTSWLVRWYNLVTYFWPEIFDGSNVLLGVRPAARVAVDGAFGFVWIESGYTWLLWGGGVPLFAAFVYFCWVCLRTLAPNTRVMSSYTSVAALAAWTAIVVVIVLMNLDPHITYRGSSDALIVLLALAMTGRRTASEPQRSAAPEEGP